MFKSTKLACVFALCLAAVLVLASCGRTTIFRQYYGGCGQVSGGSNGQYSGGPGTHYIPSDARTVRGAPGGLYTTIDGYFTQTVYEEALLEGLPVGATIIGMRLQAHTELRAWVDQTIEFFEVRLSTSENGVGCLSDTFADNRGADEVIVIPETSWEIVADDYTDCDGYDLCEFGPLISFENSFVYTGGDLLLEVASMGFGSSIRDVHTSTTYREDGVRMTVYPLVRTPNRWDNERIGDRHESYIHHIAFVYN